MKFIIGFLIAIGLLIFVFVLIFKGGNSGGAPVTEKTPLVNYSHSTSAVMQFTTEGPVNADQNHRSVQVTVGSTESSIEVINGYQGTVVKSKTYPNNSNAYADFLRALDFANFTTGDNNKALTDTRGRCSNGNRYQLEIKDGSKEIQNLWATSCNTTATFKGRLDLVQQLFKSQIPDYGTITNNVF